MNALFVKICHFKMANDMCDILMKMHITKKRIHITLLAGTLMSDSLMTALMHYRWMMNAVFPSGRCRYYKRFELWNVGNFWNLFSRICLLFLLKIYKFFYFLLFCITSYLHLISSYPKSLQHSPITSTHTHLAQNVVTTLQQHCNNIAAMLQMLLQCSVLYGYIRTSLFHWTW